MKGKCNLDHQALELIFAAAAGCGMVGTVAGLIVNAHIKKIAAASERVPDRAWFQKMGKMADLVTEHHITLKDHSRRLEKLEE